MRRIAGVTLGSLVVLLLASQLVLPPIAERRTADRLERHGGSADVSLSAFPALRLLFGDGDSLEVKGRNLQVDPGHGRDALDRLDGFDDVRVRLEDLETGPLHVSSFELLRDKGQSDYRARIKGTTSAREVASFLGSRAGGALGGLLGDLAAGSLLGGSTEVPLDFRARVHSDGGEVNVSGATGSVAGLPAGPLAQLVVNAVALSL
jgi:hypothetical protein